MASFAQLPPDRSILDIPAAVFSAELLPFLNISEVYNVTSVSRQIRKDMFDLRLLVAKFSSRYKLYLSAFNISLEHQIMASSLGSLKYFSRVFDSFLKHRHTFFMRGTKMFFFNNADSRAGTNSLRTLEYTIRLPRAAGRSEQMGFPEKNCLHRRPPV